MGLFSIFKKGLQKTAVSVSRTISGLFTGEKKWDSEAFEELEFALVAADFGVKAAGEIVKELKEAYDLGKISTSADIYSEATKLVTEILRKNQRQINFAATPSPTVILMVGVNGSGKTTTIGKLAQRWQSEGKKVVLGAADTFRAAAVEQLQLWGERTNCHVVAGKPQADPASVAFAAAEYAVQNHADIVLIDTAGRQQTRKALMDELSKIVRAIGKACPDAPHEVWLTVDASLGSNALSQAREFSKSANLTGLVLTKLDGSGKGGMTVAIHREFKLPTFFTGFGEAPEDLQEFDPEMYAAALFQSNDAE
ncbi:MAG: signal recognition particle-docking protein FtsY [Lentisphaerae bacterium]|nr:signal recognition particle-docking protein FtsY [Lentisphaerota bacterium]